MLQHSKYPALRYLAARAKSRMPHFAWEYLASGTGADHLVAQNRKALDRIELSPKVLGGRFEPDTSTRVLGRTFSVPFGASAVGLSGLMWPGAERILARTARDRNMPYMLSTVACETPEDIAAIAGENAWFQLYVPNDIAVRDDIIARADAAGIRTLVVTVDVPVNSRRERQVAVGLSVPPRMDAMTLLRIAMRPRWALETLRNGKPRFKTLEAYFPQSAMKESAHLVSTLLDGRPGWDTIDDIRRLWPGHLVIKGILRPEEARQSIEAGADAVIVSNHGGRQFDAAPASIDALPGVVDEVRGEVPVLFDGGIEWGVDILRALSLGADFCFLGRGFLMAVAALGDKGADHLWEILKQDLEVNMVQMAAKTLDEIKPGPV